LFYTRVACFVKHNALHQNCNKLKDICYATVVLTMYIVNCSWKEKWVFG